MFDTRELHEFKVLRTKHLVIYLAWVPRNCLGFHYTWKHYAERMMTLSRIYGFWKYVSDLQRGSTQRYLQMFYGLQYRPLAEAMRK